MSRGLIGKVIAVGVEWGRLMRGSPMEFVVKTIGRTGMTFWLSPPSADGFRTIVDREIADVFPTVEDAHAAIGKMPQLFRDAETLFSVESND